MLELFQEKCSIFSSFNEKPFHPKYFLPDWQLNHEPTNYFKSSKNVGPTTIKYFIVARKNFL